MLSLEVLDKGGWVMWVLGMISVYALAVMFYKAFQFMASGVFNTSFVEPVMTYVKRGELTDAERLLEGKLGPVARIMKVAIICVANRDISIKSRESEIARVGSSELRLLESHMRGLELVASVGPLLGLLGTVLGMVNAFARLGEAGSRVDPALLANGIWEALVTTVGGLMVAIPAMAAYYVLDGLIERVRATMKDVTVQILALEDEYIRNEKEQSKREFLEQERRLRELQEAQEDAMRQFRTTAQGSGTLKLLNPSYTKF
jgi:biopolymer transport protein ExbB